MPKPKNDWESEYYDPVSIAEDAKQKELGEQLNVEIMKEIELCRRMEEDEEFTARERALVEEERAEQMFNDMLLDEGYEDHAEVQH